jgi:predicted transport protein
VPPKAAEQIDWTAPRLVCVASDFTRYDEHAIAQINRGIELIRYRDYDSAFLTLDLVASTSATATAAGAEEPAKPGPRSSQKTVTQLHEQAPEELKNLYDALETYILSLGDDVTKTTRQNYFAFRRIKNFACVEIHPQAKKLLVYLKNDPAALSLEPGFTRDVTRIGHFGTGNLEVTISSSQDLDRALTLILDSYQGS